jgi:EAL domain-containing protein (putative c-di-GMP-specific phosphodiesterase class I)
VVDATPAGGTNVDEVAPTVVVVRRGAVVVVSSADVVVVVSSPMEVEVVVEPGGAEVVGRIGELVEVEVDVDVGSVVSVVGGGSDVVVVLSGGPMICAAAPPSRRSAATTATAAAATTRRSRPRFLMRIPPWPMNSTMPAADTLIIAPAGASLLGRLASLAASAGYDGTVLGPLLRVRGRRADLDAFVLTCASSVSAAEAATTRVLYPEVDIETAGALEVLAPALAADALSTLAARALHGGMLDALDAGIGVQAAYQPIIEIRSGRSVAFEALLRLQHESRNVPPLEVFKAAAEAGRLAGADAAARRAAIRGAAGWIGDRALFLNLLPASIERPDDLEDTDVAVAEAGLARSQVRFEASPAEDGDDRHLARVLEHLRTRGFGIALDDVTADRRVLALVERLRPDAVKVSRRLVQELPSLQARSAVATIVGAAHEVGARVAAIGIETKSQLDAVLFVGVDDAQGWEVGQPMRAPSGRPALVS